MSNDDGAALVIIGLGLLFTLGAAWVADEAKKINCQACNHRHKPEEVCIYP